MNDALPIRRVIAVLIACLMIGHFARAQQCANVGVYGVPSPRGEISAYHLQWLRAKSEYYRGHNQDYGALIAVLHYSAPHPDYAKVQAEAVELARDRSLQNLRGITIDDFMTFYLAAVNEKNTTFVPALLDAIHAANAKIPFGITVYHDQLPGGGRGYDTSMIPVGQRRRIGLVYLYLHSRLAEPNLSEYLKIAKQQFPNAKVYLGIYNYDRRNDERLSHPTYTFAHELSLFSTSLSDACGFVRTGAAAGVELFPGAIGAEAHYFSAQPAQATAAQQMDAEALRILQKCCTGSAH